MLSRPIFICFRFEQFILSWKCRYAYLDFKDDGSFNKALELDGSELEGYSLSVEEARPRGDGRDGADRGRGGGRDGGRFGGRDGGRFGGRRGGGRVGGRGGGGRGRGTPTRPSFASAGAVFYSLLVLM